MHKVEIWLADWVFEIKLKTGETRDYIVDQVVTPKLNFEDILKRNDGYSYNSATSRIPKSALKLLVNSKDEGRKKVKEIKFIKLVGYGNEKKDLIETDLSF